MIEMIFNLLQQLINIIFNILLTPVVAVVAALHPTLNDILISLTAIFNNYIWVFFNWIPSFLKFSLHIPDIIFDSIANTITLSVTLWAVIRSVIAFKNLWSYFHGNFNVGE